MSRRDGQRPTLGFVGGTGPQGRGLALRFAHAGYPVLIGSRSADRAKEAVSSLDGGDLDIHGVENLDACAQSQIIFVTLPYEAQRKALEELADAIGEKIVVNCVNALDFDDVGPMPREVPIGSAAQECARLLPRARVVSAFHHVSARRLMRVDEPITADVLMCGDDEDAKQQVAHLATALPGMWPVDAGPLRLSGPIEHMTAVLLSINRRYKFHSGLRIDGIVRTDETLHPNPSD